MIRKTVLRTMFILVLMIAMAAIGAQLSFAEAVAKGPSELRAGMTGEQVEQYQGRLVEYGYLKGVTGVFDDGTKLATRYFQSANKLPASGNATSATRTLINKASGVVGYQAYEQAQQTAGFKSGAFGLGVALVQDRLKDLGYYAGAVNGSYGTSTAKAVVLFKKFNNFSSASSTVSSADRAAIAASDALPYGEVYGPDTIKPGSSGEEVLEAQVILREMKYYKGKLNGKYGKDMVAAVKKMQVAYKLYPTGWLLSPTLEILDQNNEKGGVVTARAYAALDYAQDQLGKKYKLGTAGPNTFDCSGFTYYVFKRLGITLGQSAAAQSQRGKLVTKKGSIVPGDLVFFATGTSKTKINHVGLVYSTDDGNIRFVHASSARGKVITSAFIDGSNSNFYNQRFRWARRMW